MQGRYDKKDRADYTVSPDTLSDVIRSMPAESVLLDVGCAGWSVPELSRTLGRCDLRHIGADVYGEPAGKPASVDFISIASDGDEFGSNLADLVISSHCLEHSRRPVEQFRSLIRSCKPGGLIYVESPSELSALGRSDDDPRSHAFASFWDDPTHVRPYTPGALYRLGLSFRMPALRCGRLDRGGIPCAAALFRAVEEESYRYVSLRGVPPGTEAALNAIWPAPRGS